MRHIWLFLLSYGALHSMERQALTPALSELSSHQEVVTPPLPEDPETAAFTLAAELTTLKSAYTNLLQPQPEDDNWHLDGFDRATIAAGLASVLVIADRRANTRFVLTEGGYTPWIVAGIASLWQLSRELYFRIGRWRARANNAEMQETIKKNLGPRLTALEGNVRTLTQNTSKRLESMEKRQTAADTTSKSLQSEIFRLAREIDELKKQLKKKN